MRQSGSLFKARATKLILFVLCILIPVGTIGYMSIEGWDFLDAIYMTIISVTTTGYSEVHPLSHAGRVFTSFLLLIGMATVAVSLSMIMHDILSIDFEKRRALKMKDKIKKLKNHTVICGFGRVGKVACEELQKNNMDFVVVERDPEHLRDASERGYYFIEGDATADYTLVAAGIEKASVLAALTDHVADNLYICLTGKALNDQAFIVARGQLEESEQKLRRAGADRVILPYHDSGIQTAHVIMHPQFHDFLPIRDLKLSPEESIKMTEIEVEEMGDLIGRTIAESQARLRKIVVIGVKSADGEFHFSPTGQYRFSGGDVLVIVSTANDFERARQIDQLAA